MVTYLQIGHGLMIPDTELQETFIKAPGPGGQNVNKVTSAVQLRFDVVRSPSLPEMVRTRLLELAGSRLTKEGVLIIEASRFRSQSRNRADARDRLKELIRAAAEPRKLRKATRPTRNSLERRLEAKRRRGKTKHQRRTPAEREN